VLKSGDLATWTRLPFPFVPKAYHVLSSAWTKLGSGKLVSSASQGPWARGWIGEARAVVKRQAAAAAHVKDHILMRYMCNCFMK